MKQNEGDTTVSYERIFKTQWINLFYTLLLRPMLPLLRTQINVLERPLLIIVTKTSFDLCILHHIKGTESASDNTSRFKILVFLEFAAL